LVAAVHEAAAVYNPFNYDYNLAAKAGRSAAARAVY